MYEILISGEHTMNKKTLRMIIIIAAAAIILAAAGFLVYKFFIKKPAEEFVRNEYNVTVFRCHMGQVLTESDLNNIKEVVNKAIGDKVLDMSVGTVPLSSTNYVYDENGDPVYFGDLAVIICSLLDEEEVITMANAVWAEYKITDKFSEENLTKIMAFDDQYRAEYDK